MTAQKRLRSCLPAELRREVERLKHRLIADSALTSHTEKETLAELAAYQHVRYKHLVEQEIAGGVSGEVARTMSGMPGNYRRYCEALQLADEPQGDVDPDAEES